jgi:predicted NBD/HSP70 family sugar kinase
LPAFTADDEVPAESSLPRGAESRLSTRGSNQGGLRQYNERVVQQALRLHGPLPGADLARLTGLTAQTVSLITKRLLDEGYLRKGAPVRGKVGQPSVPLSLNPQGAYAVGLKVGRRQLDALLVDFTGEVQGRWSWTYAFPDPDALLSEIARRLTAVRRKLGPEGRDRVCGVGIAAPLALGGWQSLLGVAPEQAQRWAGLKLRDEVARRCEWPVLAMKDTSAACVAELVSGRGRSLHSFLYLFVDTFIGGGLVIDSHLHTGATGNAGAVGSMSLGPAGSGAGQLLSVASLNTLEQAWAAAGLAPAAEGQALQSPWREVTQRWLAQSGPALAHAIHGAACLLDLHGVIIDGVLSRDLLKALIRSTEAAMKGPAWEGVVAPRLFEGAVGADAAAMGGALLPLHANFAPDRELFLKDMAV